MRLADHVMAAPGTEVDANWGGSFTSLAQSLKQAEVFELSDDVALAAYHLTRSKPSAMLGAMPMCRAPYTRLWLEWRGGLLGGARSEKPRRETAFATPNPVKQGCMIETDKSGQAGIMTFVWLHKESHANLGLLNIAPLGSMFDWSGTHDLRRAVANEAASIIGDVPVATARMGAGVEALLALRYADELTDDIARQVLNNMAYKGWDKLVNDAGERAALIELNKREIVRLNPHARKFVHLFANQRLTSQAAKDRFMEMVIPAWENDIEGEPAMIEAVIAMMNSRNAIEHRDVDLTKLNKSRARHGRPQFLKYRTTHLRLSQAQQRAFRAGLLSREEAGWHRVRGHFKIRKTGIYWWSPFFRGDPARNAMRDTYTVE